MGEWQETNLGSLTSKIGSGATPKGGGNAYKKQGISLIRSQNVLDFRFSYDGLAFIDDSQAEKLKNVEVWENDVLLNITGDSVARCCVVDNSCLPARVNQHVTIIRPIPEQADYRYIYYYLQFLKPELLSQSEIGATRRALTKGMLESLDIHIPLIKAEQKAIAEVLSSLDDKIDLLHRQNQTLEALAETLFRHTFIDGAQDDWEVKPLDEIAHYLNGLACQKYPAENESEKLPVLKIKDLRTGISAESDWATSNVDEKYIVKSGDIIFSWSASLMIKVWNGQNCVLNQHLFKVTSDKYPRWLIYFWTKHHMKKFIVIAEGKATTMGHIKRSDLSSSMTMVPSDESALEKIDAQINPLFEKMVCNNAQISTLESYRDTLLPKLMSGDIRVQYDETIMPEAT